MALVLFRTSLGRVISLSSLVLRVTLMPEREESAIVEVKSRELQRRLLSKKSQARGLPAPQVFSPPLGCSTVRLLSPSRILRYNSSFLKCDHLCLIGIGFAHEEWRSNRLAAFILSITCRNPAP